MALTVLLRPHLVFGSLFQKIHLFVRLKPQFLFVVPLFVAFIATFGTFIVPPFCCLHCSIWHLHLCLSLPTFFAAFFTFIGYLHYTHLTVTSLPLHLWSIKTIARRFTASFSEYSLAYIHQETFHIALLWSYLQAENNRYSSNSFRGVEMKSGKFSLFLLLGWRFILIIRKIWCDVIWFDLYNFYYLLFP